MRKIVDSFYRSSETALTVASWVAFDNRESRVTRGYLLFWRKGDRHRFKDIGKLYHTYLDSVRGTNSLRSISNRRSMSGLKIET